ncbi:MAG: hypothetical protein PUB98_10405 [Clostridiales bacterium]|nr:hypothetical protein [Clostridiales bacterium]
MEDSLRAEIIKQFPSQVVKITDKAGNAYYACPTCKRVLAQGTEKCSGCGQVLAWDMIREEEFAQGTKKATLEFEVPVDFAKGDCRKCPLSYIGKEHDENVYECPLKMRANCRLTII